jgi:hypothetical protein
VFMDNDARYKPFLAETKPSAIISRYLKVGL